MTVRVLQSMSILLACNFVIGVVMLLPHTAHADWYPKLTIRSEEQDTDEFVLTVCQNVTCYSPWVYVVSYVKQVQGTEPELLGTFFIPDCKVLNLELPESVPEWETVSWYIDRDPYQGDDLYQRDPFQPYECDWYGPELTMAYGWDMRRYDVDVFDQEAATTYEYDSE